MTSPMFLLILLLSACAAAGNAESRIYEIHVAVGSSFSFPPVNTSTVITYDLNIKDNNQTLIANYHGFENVRPLYKQRGFFSRNGTELSFVLRNLTKEDSKTYEQVVNMKVMPEIRLHVIEPVNKPNLQIVNETIEGRQCHVLLECRVQGPELLNVIFLKNGEEIIGNITRMGQSSFFIIDAWDPRSPGTYTCKTWNPLGAKTSQDIPFLSTEDKCKNATRNPPIWIIIIIIIIIILLIGTTILIGIIVYRKRLQKSGEKTNPNESSLLTKKPSEDEESQDSSRTAPDPEEPGDNVTLGNDFPNSPDPAHCGQEDTSSMEPELLVSAPDSGQEAFG